jgi:glycosyltransferase involved in cell wall biosynthesis
MFCGRFAQSKNPLFMFQVATLASRLLGRRVRLLFVGSGPLADAIQKRAKRDEDDVDCHIAGFAKQHDLPEWYASARLFLFPTLKESWGVVANEAIAAGLPVLVSKGAGCAGDLVLDDLNGYVLPLDATVWAERCAALLQDLQLYRRMSTASVQSAKRFTFEAAAQGVIDAVQSSLDDRYVRLRQGI